MYTFGKLFWYKEFKKNNLHIVVWFQVFLFNTCNYQLFEHKELFLKQIIHVIIASDILIDTKI